MKKETNVMTTNQTVTMVDFTQNVLLIEKQVKIKGGANPWTDLTGG